MEQEWNSIVKELSDTCHVDELFATKAGLGLPSWRSIINLLKDFRRVLFPGYFGDELTSSSSVEYFLGYTLAKLREELKKQMELAFVYQYHSRKENLPDRYEEEELYCACSQPRLAISDKVDGILDRFFAKLPKIQQMLLLDVQAGFDGDPAAKSREEIIFSYPGFLAILVYRLAHELYVEEVPFIPRTMTEYAHGKTGIDINAGATIGKSFFIDHGTGVVIGETTVIGDHVKIYQGVTLGALSTSAGQQLSGTKRHPTIEDYVTIYANATILGGDTVIGSNSVIGGNAFIIKSVAPDTKIRSNTH